MFIPVFFVASGVKFDLNAPFAPASTVARVPLFLLAIYLARGLPALAYAPLLGRAKARVAGVLQATSLPSSSLRRRSACRSVRSRRRAPPVLWLPACCRRDLAGAQPAAAQVP